MYMIISYNRNRINAGKRFRPLKVFFEIVLHVFRKYLDFHIPDLFKTRQRNSYLTIFKKLAKTFFHSNCHITYMFYPHTGTDLANQVGVGHYHHIFYEGCLTNFDIKDNEEEEASLLYTDVQYTMMDEYMKRYL